MRISSGRTARKKSSLRSSAGIKIVHCKKTRTGHSYETHIGHSTQKTLLTYTYNVSIFFKYMSSDASDKVGVLGREACSRSGSQRLSASIAL
jgi:hypothetical protein